MGKKSQLFVYMSGRRTAWPFLVILPALWALFVGLGWSQNDIIEDEVSKIWIATSGDYYKDRQYEKSLDLGDSTAASTFLAMSISRDEGNLFTADRLEEIRSRMETTELITVRTTW